MEAERKIVQNAFLCGKRHDNKTLKVQILLSRNFVVIAQAPNHIESDRTFVPSGPEIPKDLQQALDRPHILRY